jgi:hypothetical protein
MEKETSRLSHDARHKRRAPRMLEGWGQGRLVHECVVQQHLGILRALDLGKTTIGAILLTCAIAVWVYGLFTAH